MVKIGDKYGRLTVIGLSRRYNEWNRYGMVECLCRCECGREVKVLWKNISAGRSLSCGCLRKKVDREEIRRLRLEGKSYGEISKITGYSKSSIYGVINNE